MTSVESAQQAEAAGPAPVQAAPAAKPAPAPPPSGGSIAAGIGVGITLLAVLILGFAGYLYFLSGVQEARTQTSMYATLSGELANGVAPLGPTQISPAAASATASATGAPPMITTPPGSPVAILSIPAIGVRNEVVVQGTTPENLANGPGHLRDSPMPGQGGTSVLYGRRETFGAPFARLPLLRPGDKIKVTTGQGTATYVVKIVGNSQNRILINPAPNQLLLLTADAGLVPNHYFDVSATLTSAVQQTPGGYPSLSSAEVALGNDPTALILTMAWGLALVIVSIGGTIAAARWSRWPAYLAFVPIALAVVWNLYANLSALLPNLY